MDEQKDLTEQACDLTLTLRSTIQSIIINLLRMKVDTRGFEKNWKKSLDFLRGSLNEFKSKEILVKILNSIQGDSLTKTFINLFITSENRDTEDKKNLVINTSQVFTIDEITDVNFYNQ